MDKNLCTRFANVLLDLKIFLALLGAPSSDSMSADLRNNRRNNPAEEFGEEEQGDISLV